MTTIRCDIVSAEQEIFHGEATLVVATGELGELGIAPRHAPLITRLKPGKVVVTLPDGSHLETVELPVANPTSVAFGGPDMSTLFVGTARENLTEQDLEQAPRSGAVFAVPTTVHGFPANTFSG